MGFISSKSKCTEHTRNPKTQGVQAGGSEVQPQPQLHSEFGASLGYMNTCLKEKHNKTNTDLENWLGG